MAVLASGLLHWGLVVFSYTSWISMWRCVLGIHRGVFHVSQLRSPAGAKKTIAESPIFSAPDHSRSLRSLLPPELQSGPQPGEAPNPAMEGPLSGFSKRTQLPTAANTQCARKTCEAQSGAARRVKVCCVGLQRVRQQGNTEKTHFVLRGKDSKQRSFKL